MPTASQPVLSPRKSPIQARSTASVDAIRQATIQVLLAVGKDRLTTTRVAARAGVSVGTLYQYFPNKGALLQAVLRAHMEDIADAVDRVCLSERGAPLNQIATELVSAFLNAKMKNPRISVALYAISADVDGTRIAQEIGHRITASVVTLLTAAREPLSKDPQLVAAMLQGAMAGVSRRLVESDDPTKHFIAMRDELTLIARSYLTACTG